MSGKDTKKRLNLFLKERGLLTAYRRYKSVKRRTRKKVTIDGSTIPVVIYKKGDKTVMAHAFDYRIIVTSKKYNTRTITNAVEDKKLKPRFIKLRRFKNFNMIESATLRRKKLGRVVMRVKFRKDGKSQIVEADNGFTVPLVSRNERARAENKAFERCKAQLKFYDATGYEILWVHYLYAEKKGVVRI